MVKVTVTWKNVARIEEPIMSLSGRMTNSYNFEPSPGPSRMLGIPNEYSYVPLHLKPTSTFYQDINKSVDNKSLNLKEFILEIAGIGNCKTSINIRLYQPDICILDVKISLSLPAEAIIDDLLIIRSANTRGQLKALVSRAIAQITKSDEKQFSFTGNPMYLLEFDSDDPTAIEFWTRNRRGVVGLLIGNSNYESMNEDLVASIESQNSEVNKKSDTEFLFANKQGLVVLRTNSNSSRGTGLYRRATLTYENAVVAYEFLRRFKSIRQENEDFADFILEKLSKWIANPSAIFSSSFSTRFTWQIVSESMSLPQSLRLIRDSNPALLEQLAEKSAYFLLISPEWYLDPEAASTISTSATSNHKYKIDWIDNELAKTQIRTDLMEADRSNITHCYKAAVVMAGSAAESIALATLLEAPTTKSAAELQKMSLHALLEEIRSLNLAIDPATISIVDESLRQWRNLVHPGVQMRKGTVITRQKANLAIAAIHDLVNEFNSLTI